MSTPQTEIKICSGVRLDSRYVHSIHFDSFSDQLAYFEGKVVKTFSSYSYCRKSWSIKVEATMTQANAWNYLFFKNAPGFDWWFYFIDRVEYVNDNTVELFLTLDVIQTYMFSWELLPCFIERQHTVSDGFGEHLEPEGLDVGEQLVAEDYLVDLNRDGWCVICLSTLDTFFGEGNVNVLSKLDNVFTGLVITATPESGYEALRTRLKQLDSEGTSGGILAMWMYPKCLVNLAPHESWESNTYIKLLGNHPVAVGSFELGINQYNFTPKNKKLLTYPYNYIEVSNCQNEAQIYRYETFLFQDDNIANGTIIPTYRIVGAYSPEAGCRFVWQYYNNGRAWDEGVALKGFPTCAWDHDAYKVWLAQNQNTQNLSMVTGGITTLGGAITAGASLASGNVLGAGAGAMTAVHGLTSIAGILAQRADKEIQPHQARGNYSASVNVGQGMQDFALYQMRVTNAHARVIDDYFTMYGYKQNRVQVPNIKARPSFTYIKTIGCTIGGNIGNEDRVQIEKIFDNGITFWTKGDRIGDYSQDNSPVQ